MRKTRDRRRSNPVAKSLSEGQNQPRRERNRKRYTRKEKHPDRREENQPSGRGAVQEDKKRGTRVPKPEDPKFEPGTIKMLFCYFPEIRSLGCGWRVVWDVSGPRQHSPTFLCPSAMTLWRGTTEDYRGARELPIDDPARILEGLRRTREKFARLKISPTGGGCTEAVRRVERHLEELAAAQQKPVRIRTRSRSS